MPPLDLSPDLITEITDVVFGEPAPAPRPCDLIFVFGGSHPELWEKTAEAYFKGLGREIIVTGGYKPGAQRHPAWVDGDTREAHVLRRELIRLGVPASVIFSEDRSTNSLENVLFAREAYDFWHISSILVVSKSYAIGRQLRTLRQHIDPSIQTIPYAFDARIKGIGPLINRFNWTGIEEARGFVITQLLKIWVYGCSGDIQPIQHPSPELMAFIQSHL